MNARRSEERRLFARIRFASPLNARVAPIGKTLATRHVLRARTENISAGGLCIRTQKLLNSSSLVRCELRLPGTPVHVPFLAQARWVQKRSGVRPYRVGLQFVV